MLTLSDVARGFGLTVTLQQVKNRVQALERRTGRRILLVSGRGKGKRYMVNAEELAAAMGCSTLDSVDTMANQAADAVEAQNKRIQAISERLLKVEQHVGLR